MLPKVVILLPSEAYVSSAESVAAILGDKFTISEISIRSAQAPLDRLMPTTTSGPVSLLVFYSEDPKRPTATATLLQKESPFPVLEIIPSQNPSEIAWTIAKVCSLGSLEVAEKVLQATVERRQASLVEDAQYQTKSPKYIQAIASSYDQKAQITGDKIGLEGKRGKVRDQFDVNEKFLAMVTTDRQSGFDRMLGHVPFKGAVLNLTSAFWFEKTKHIIPNHLLSVPHANVSLVKRCQPFPIEFVVR
jgi:hypothetical protein